MSNLRSISEGSFVLGDTNGLTFEAGSGIKITETSEGTVRIANDETVLFDGNSATANLTESFSAFEKIDIWYTYWPGKYTTKRLYGWIDGTQPTFAEGWFDDNGTAVVIFFSRFSTNADKTQISFITNKFWNPQGSSLTDSISNAKIVKVIGINRISGGNA